MKEQVCKFIEDFIGAQIEDHDEDLLESGLVDSLNAMSLLVELEKEFKVKFSFSEYSQEGFLTVTKISNAISNQGK